MFPSPLSSPTSRARSPPYTSSSQSSQSQSPSGGMNRPLYTNPDMAFAATSKKYLGSTAGERRVYGTYGTDVDPRDPQQRRRESMGSSMSSNGSGSGSGSVTPGPRSPGSPIYLPPVRPTEGFSHATPASMYPHHHKELGSGIVRPSTGMATSRTSTRSPDYANGAAYQRHHEHPNSPYSSATSHYSSTTGSPPSSTASPPPHGRSSHSSHGSHGAYPQTNGHSHGHSRHHSQQMHHSSSRTNANAYATDYVSSNKLVPNRPSRRNTTDVTTGSGTGSGLIGPAAAGGIPPVLPRPPSVTGSAVSSGMLRREFRKHKTIMDDEEIASKLLNTYN